MFVCFLATQYKYMDDRKTVLELKDVPPPPPHQASSSQSLQPFPLPPVPLLPPCLPPRPHPTQDSHQAPPPQPPPLPAQLQQEGASPKVSICVQCDFCRADGFGFSVGTGFAGSSSKVVGVGSVCMSLSSVGGPANSGIVARPGPCSVTSSVCHYKHTVKGHGGQVLTSSPGLAYKPQPPSSVATSQPVSSHPYLACCPGVLHTCPSVPLSVPSLYPSSAPMAPSLPCVSSVPASMPSSCLASSGYPSCGVECCLSARRCQRSTHGDHPANTTTTTTTSSAHFYSNSMHLNVGHTVCVKGAHCCQDCMLKVGKGCFFFLCVGLST